MDDCNGDNPVGENYAEVLNQLFSVVATPAAKDPELVQEKMATDRDAVSDRHSDQRRERPAENCQTAKVDNRHGAAHRNKTQKSKNPLSTQ
jgi:hypothetical protein